MMIPMLIVSITAVAFMIERGIALQQEKILPKDLMEALKEYLQTGVLPPLKQAIVQNPSALARLLSASINHLSLPRISNQGAIETQARKEVILLEKWLVILEIIVGIAPLMGLLGTLHGMITLFGGLGSNFGAADPAVIAAGISVTLNVTFMGLAIAVPALVAWSIYNKKVETLTMELETAMEEFLQKVYKS